MARLPSAPTPTDEFPISLRTFAGFLMGTEDEVWIKLLENQSAHDKMTFSQWKTKLKSLKG